MIIKKYKKFIDKRGHFSKLVSISFIKINNIKKIKEINFSYSKKKGTIRGLHYQSGKFKETKIIYVLRGKIFDVSLNLKNNKTKSSVLSASSKKFIVIKENFAHGFQTLKDNTCVLYVNTKEHNKVFERRINPFNKRINIKWPIKKYIISKKDLLS
jgi:dTDP-4-dehydrorhamnose 3,5-epimerase